MAGVDQKDLRGKYLSLTRALVLDALAATDCKIYLFGSHARGDAGPYSDIDIAIDLPATAPPSILARLRDRLEESTIPLRVDVIDMRDADADLRARIRQEGLLWSG